MRTRSTTRIDEAPTVRRIPGPRRRPVVGLLPELSRDPLGTFVRLWREHGDMVLFHVGGTPLYLVSSASGIKHVLQDDHTNYRKSRVADKIATVLGTGLFTAEGSSWLRQRRLMQPAFHRNEIEGFASIMTGEAAALAERLEARAASGEAFDVAPELMRLTLNVVTRSLFGTGITPNEEAVVARVLPPLLEAVLRRTNNPFDVLERLPTPANRRFEGYRRALDEIVYRVIAERRGSGEERPDLLGMLMAARDADTGESMSDQQLRDEVLTLFVAGHETTANLLAWALVLLGRHPEARERLEAEVDGALAGRTPTADDARTLAFARRVVQETLRLYPPAWGTGRRPLTDDLVDGYPVPAGHNVIVDFFNLHRHPDHWTDPEAFDPDRFLPERSEGRLRSAYVPFGAGPRMCIGASFAMLEGVLVLAVIASRFRLELVPDHPIVPEATLTLRPKRGVLVRAARRKGF